MTLFPKFSSFTAVLCTRIRVSSTSIWMDEQLCCTSADNKLSSRPNFLSVVHRENMTSIVSFNFKHIFYLFQWQQIWHHVLYETNWFVFSTGCPLWKHPDADDDFTSISKIVLFCSGTHTYWIIKIKKSYWTTNMILKNNEFVSSIAWRWKENKICSKTHDQFRKGCCHFSSTFPRQPSIWALVLISRNTGISLCPRWFYHTV